MKLGFISQDLPEDTWISFAKFLGWTEQTMTTTESPNYLIDNPQTFIMFLEDRYLSPIRNDIKSYNMDKANQAVKDARAAIDAQIEAAKPVAEEYAETLISIVQE